jgi:hypothetical protein
MSGCSGFNPFSLITILDTSVLANALEFPVTDTTAVRYPTILPNPNHPRSRCCTSLLLAALLWLAGCAHEKPLLIEDTKYFEGDMPADFSGYWQRDYASSDNINQVLRNAYYELGRRSRTSQGGIPMASDRDRSRLLPLARLVELITRTDELTISQTEHEILVERRDDFSLMCAFFDGVAKPIDSAFGKETCGWNEDRLISVNEFPDGLRVIHQFQISADRKQLRVITTATSKTAPMPFTVSLYYWRVEKRPGKFACIETLSMKRVCSTGELAL